MAGALLLVLASAFVLVAVLAGIGSLLDHDAGAIGGGVFLLICGSVLGQVARVVLRGGAPSVLTNGEERAVPMQAVQEKEGHLPLVGQRIDRSVRYREWFCQFPPVATAIAVVCLIVVIVLIAAVGGSSSPGPQGFLFLLLAPPLIYLVGVLLYLPYGIQLSDGVLQLGVRGVPRVARVWRRERIPLDVVLGWHVAASKTPSPNSSYRSRRGRVRVPSPKSIGDLRGPGVRTVLTVRIDPMRYRIRFPGAVLVGYTVRSSASLGYRDTGTVSIGTHRPVALARALEAAMPGRREADQRVSGDGSGPRC